MKQGAGGAIAVTVVAFGGYLYLSGRMPAVWAAIFGSPAKGGPPDVEARELPPAGPGRAPTRTDRFGRRTVSIPAGPRCPVGRIVSVAANSADNCRRLIEQHAQDCGHPLGEAQRIAVRSCQGF